MDKHQMDEKSISVLVDSKIKSATAWYNSKLSKEREKVIKYYNGELPVRQKEGSSPYVSNDVYDSVEALKGQLLETFASGFEIVKFDPQNPQDVASSRIATLYTDYVMFRQNEGYRIFNDVIHDGLTARVGVVKVWWDEEFDYQDEEFEELPEDHVQQMATHEEVHELEAEVNDESGLYSGKLTRKISKSQVRIEVVNPEEFAIESEAKSLSSDYFVCHTTMKTIAELERMGYSKAKLKEANPTEQNSYSYTPEKLARFSEFEPNVFMKPEETQDEMRKVEVHECYMKLIREGDVEKLYKIVKVGAVVLDIEEVDELPFIAFVPLPIPHSFYGNNYAKKVIPAQNVRSSLTRQIIDHGNITNNPRYMVMRGGLTNPRELLDNRLGGLVNVTRPDAVMPLPQYGLNPFVFQALQMIEAANEKTTGVSSLSQGLNKDAISNQNSQGMVNDLVNLSQTRQKVIARNFANNFLVPLYLRIYKLVLENEKKQNIVELAGDWVPVDPRLWNERKTATVSFHLGYGEQDREAMKRIELAAIIGQDPGAAAFFQPDGKYRYVCDIFKLKGIANVNDYLTPPDKIPPPQPDPMKVQEVQNDTTKAQAAMITAQAHAQKVQAHTSFEGEKLDHQKLQDRFKNILSKQDQERKDHEALNKIDISQREMHLAETAPEEETIVSPNG